MNETARKSFGEVMYANIAMLGTLAKTPNLENKKAIEEAIRETISGKIIEINMRAFRKGFDQNFNAH